MALGVGLVLVGAGAILTSTAFDAQPSLELAGGNRPVNAGARDPTDVSAQSSPTLVRDPRDSARLAIANRVDAPRFSCALRVSRDGGSTWTQSPIPAPQLKQVKCYDPDVAFGADGTLYLSFVTLQGRRDVPAAAWLSSSTDGGRTLSKPRRLLGGRPLQVRLVADPSVPRRLYVTWLAAAGVRPPYALTGAANPLMLERSDDGGRSWTAPVKVNDPARTRVLAPSLAVGPRRELYVLYLDLGRDELDYRGLHEGTGGAPFRGPWQLVLARSRDGGRSWSSSVVEPRLVPSERLSALTPPLPSVAVDRRRGRVFAAFQDGRLGDPDVWLWSSSNGGVRWSHARRVNDTDEHDRTAQYLPRLALAPDGRVDVLYYDRRADPRNVLADASLQSSFDGGRSFRPRLRLSERSFSSMSGRGGERPLPELGDRLALLSTNEAAFAVWTDTRAATRASGKQDLASGLATFSRPARLSDGAKKLLRVGGAVMMLAGLVLIASPALQRTRARAVRS